MRSRDITPILLTLDEMANLERTLDSLDWADRILVVDSGSTDGTLDLLSKDPRIEVYHRAFDDFASQWNHALARVRTPWALYLDADHRLSSPLVQELLGLEAPEEVSGYSARFVYCIEGRPIRSGIYPDRVLLVRPGRARFLVDGHSQRLELDGSTRHLEGVVFHDDRKPRERWLASQARYAEQEALTLRSTPWRQLGWADRTRKHTFLAPLFVALYCLVIRGGLLDGRAGWRYAHERVLAERFLRRRLRSRAAVTESLPSSPMAKGSADREAAPVRAGEGAR